MGLKEPDLQVTPKRSYWEENENIPQHLWKWTLPCPEFMSLLSSSFYNWWLVHRCPNYITGQTSIRKEMQSDLKALFNIIWFTSIFSSLKIHLKEIHYLEHSDFSKGDFLYDRVIFWFQKPLDSHNLTRVPVSAFENNSIGSFTNFPNFFILLHHRGINLLKMDLHIVRKCRL